MTKIENASVENVAKRLVWLRNFLGLSQRDFASAIDVLPSQLNNWEKGRHRLSLEGALKINEIFGTTLDFIYLDRRNSLPHEMVVALSAIETEGEPASKEATSTSKDTSDSAE